MEFYPQDKQEQLFTYLKSQDLETYQFLQPSNETIFLRQTGDNFRASARMPTEQISFSILNLKQMVNNPYGQIINVLWRGQECRKGLNIHLKEYLEELHLVSKVGVDLIINGKLEYFNLVFFSGSRYWALGKITWKMLICLNVWLLLVRYEEV